MSIKDNLKKYPRVYSSLRFLHNVFNFFSAKIKKHIPYQLRTYTRGAAFGGDPFLKKMVVNLSKLDIITSCVETGSFKGDTTLFLAKVFPNIFKYSIEISDEYFRESAWRVRDYKKSKLIKGSSPVEIKKLIKDNDLGNLPLFFLDAHWNDYCPTKDELLLISKINKAIIIIHDFEVIGHPEYGLYRPKGISIGIGFEYISSFLKGNYNYLSPNYEARNAYENVAPTGYVLLFQNFGNAEWNRILDIPMVKSFYTTGKI